MRLDSCLCGFGEVARIFQIFEHENIYRQVIIFAFFVMWEGGEEMRVALSGKEGNRDLASVMKMVRPVPALAPEPGRKTKKPAWPFSRTGLFQRFP
jgi:hypothetical protein